MGIFFYGPVNTTGPWIAQYVGLSTKITTEEARCMRTVCVFYYCRTYYTDVRVGGGEWRTCAMRDDGPRPVWMSLLITHRT